MIEEIINVDGQNWKVKARNKQAALDEIAHARVTGSLGSSSEVVSIDGTAELIAEVHKVDEDGNWS